MTVRLGQIPQVGVQPDLGVACYRCGTQPPRLMTAAMAAMVPGGCVKVAPSDCEALQVQDPQGSTSTGTLQTSTGGPLYQVGSGSVDMTFRVMRADSAGAAAGVKVSPSIVQISTGNTVSTLPDQVTGADGTVRFHATSPAPSSDYWLVIKVSPVAGGLAFQPVTARVHMSIPNGVTALSNAVVVCPKGVDPVVCEVGRKQLQYQSLLASLGAAWDVRSNAAQGLISDQAHAVIRDQGAEDPRLARAWADQLSYFVVDLRVRPMDFPALLENNAQMARVLETIPWPGEGTLKDLFRRCAMGVKIQGGYSLVDAPLYVSRLSAFFPKDDDEIRKALATRFLEQLPTIYACMEHKIKKKARNLERQAEKWRIIGTVATFLTASAGVLDINNISAMLLSAGVNLQSFSSAIDFSRFMMGYEEFILECAGAEAEDFTCEYMAPFILWCMEAILMTDFFDYVAEKAGLPGARPGLTQDEVVKPMVQDLQGAGVYVAPAVETPGGKSQSPGQAIATVAGIGGVSALALLLFGAFRR